MPMGSQKSIRTETDISLILRSWKQEDDYFVVLDLKSAYDKVDRHKLLTLYEKNLPACLTKMIRLTLGPLRISARSVMAANTPVN